MKPPVYLPPNFRSAPQGNAFHIIGVALRAARKAGWTKTSRELIVADMMSSDYEHLLDVLFRHFEVYTHQELRQMERQDVT